MLWVPCFLSALNYLETNLLELANLAVVASGVAIAYMGLNAWKKQLRGQDEYKLSLEIMETSYDLEERLRLARGRLFTYKLGEMDTNESQRNEHYKQHADRVNYLLETNNKLRVLKLRADALWGKNEPKEINEIITIIKQFVIDFELFYESGWDDPERRIGDDTANQVWEVLHGVYRKNREDEFWLNFQDKLSKIETKMRRNITLDNK